MLSAILKNSSRRVITRPINSTTATRFRFLATVANTQQKDQVEVPSFFPDEPSTPSMVTAVPGPKSKQIMSKLNQYQDTRSVFFVAGMTIYSVYMLCIKRRYI